MTGTPDAYAWPDAAEITRRLKAGERNARRLRAELDAARDQAATATATVTTLVEGIAVLLADADARSRKCSPLGGLVPAPRLRALLREAGRA